MLGNNQGTTEISNQTAKMGSQDQNITSLKEQVIALQRMLDDTVSAYTQTKAFAGKLEERYIQLEKEKESEQVCLYKIKRAKI